MSFISETFFKNKNWVVKTNQVFIMMPFVENEKYDSSKVYSVLKDSLSEKNVIRADSIFNTQDIMSRVWELVNCSGVLIADLSTKNPNVMYETGLANSLGRDVILISNNEQDIPIDLKTSNTYLLYNSLDELGTKIPEFVKEYYKSNNDYIFSAQIMANKISHNPYLKDLFNELANYDGRLIAHHADKSRMKDEYTKKKYSICLTDFFFINKGLFVVNDFNEHGKGTIKITSFGLEVKKLINA